MSVLQTGSRKLIKPVKRGLRRIRSPRKILALAFKRAAPLRAMLRRMRRPDVAYIGVTGSCGKTTTTKLIEAVLSERGECSIDAFNSPRRVVDNILTITPRTAFCVQEISGSRPGRVRLQTKYLRPQIAVITTVGSDHYKNFRSLDATAREKSQLVAFLPRRGTAVLNADDPHVIAMRDRTRARVITYGISPDADIRAEDVKSLWPDRLSLTVVVGNERVRVETRLVGEFWITSVLPAVACGLTCGLDLKTCARAISRFDPVFGRASVHAMRNGSTYILETQKAPLWTIANTIAIMRKARARRKTMLFGTVSDYAGKGGETHRKVARQALQVSDRVIFVGPQAGHVSKLRQGKLKDRVFSFVTSYQASAFLAETVVPGELVHIKASITDHLERILLTQLDGVKCWRERCGVEWPCMDCRHYAEAHAPPFGLDGTMSVREIGEPLAAREASSA